MLGKSFFKKTMVVVILAVFAFMGYLGYRFIQQASESASGMSNQLAKPVNPVNINNDNLYRFDNKVIALNQQTTLWKNEQGFSTGEDIHIERGEFDYRTEPKIRLSLLNQSNFTATSMYISIKLFINGETQTPAAEVLGLPVTFSAPLAASEKSIETVLLPKDGAWNNPAIQHARQRRLLVQIVSVNDGDHDDVDYPQTSSGVWLRQVGGDEEQRAASEVENTETNIDMASDVEENSEIDNATDEFQNNNEK